MARFMVQNRVDNKEGLKDFSEDGYTFAPELSGEDDLTFLREQS